MKKPVRGEGWAQLLPGAGEEDGRCCQLPVLGRWGRLVHRGFSLTWVTLFPRDETCLVHQAPVVSITTGHTQPVPAGLSQFSAVVCHTFCALTER